MYFLEFCNVQPSNIIMYKSSVSEGCFDYFSYINQLQIKAVALHLNTTSLGSKIIILWKTSHVSTPKK